MRFVDAAFDLLDRLDALDTLRTDLNPKLLPVLETVRCATMRTVELESRDRFDPFLYLAMFWVADVLYWLGAERRSESLRKVRFALLAGDYDAAFAALTRVSTNDVSNSDLAIASDFIVAMIDLKHGLEG